jgi:hypothetical protein
MTAKDFLGKDITVGCKVVFISPKLRDFKSGTVIHITAAMLAVEHQGWREKEETKRFHDQVIVVE